MTALPATRLLRRQRAVTGWGLAVALTALVNLGIVAFLAKVSNLAVVPEPPPTQAVRINAVEPPPPATPPADEEPPAPSAEPPPPPTAPALPAIELAAPAAEPSFVLPEIAIGADLADLPLHVPVWTAGVPAPAAPAPGPAGAATPLAFDEAPELTGAFDLERFYPRPARLRRVEGQSTLRLDIDAAGVVLRVVVLTSTPPQVFDSAAERLGRELRFKPARRAGTAVPATFTLTLEWKLDR